MGTHGWVAGIASHGSATWPLEIPGTQPPFCDLVVNYCLKWPGIVENSTCKRKKCTFIFMNSDPCIHKEIRVRPSV